MPRPRFERLPEDKRARILDAAAREFAAHGYENASLNKILELAGISKGAAYYYFDDKLDLYITTLHYCQAELLAGLTFDPSRLTTKTFWPEITGLYRHQFTHYYERPWVFGLAKAAGPRSLEEQAQGSLAASQEATRGLFVQIVERGQNLGTVREDLPADLLQALLVAVDTAHDRWLSARWAELSPAGIDIAAERITGTLQRLLAPQEVRPQQPLWWRWATKIAPHILKSGS